MYMVNGHCCIGHDAHVWPNFCPTISFIGTSRKKSKWQIKANVDIPTLTGESVYEKLIPDGVYRVGRPDIPNFDYHWRPNVFQLASFFVTSVIVMLLATYIYGRLDEESIIRKGQEIEKIAPNRRSSFDDELSINSDDYSNESLSPVGRETHGPVPDQPAVENPPMPEAVIPEMQTPAMASSSSMAFGLLPPLPRGRSATNSALPTPRRS
jgi:hypothetical protein